MWKKVYNKIEKKEEEKQVMKKYINVSGTASVFCYLPLHNHSLQRKIYNLCIASAYEKIHIQCSQKCNERGIQIASRHAVRFNSSMLSMEVSEILISD